MTLRELAQRYGKPIIIALVCIFALVMVRKSLPDVAKLHPTNYGMLALGTVLFAVTYLIQAFGWHLLLRALGQPVSVVDSARMFFMSMIARWMPGRVLYAATRLYIGRQIGISVTAVAFAIVLELIYILLGGVIVIVLGQARASVGNDVLLGIAAIMGSALCYAVNIVLMRRQALVAKPLEINFFQCVTVMGLWLLAIPIASIPAWPGGQWLWVAVACLLSTAGTLLFAWAYARGPASYLAATEYSGFLWASVLGWLVFREAVSLYTLTGAVLIVGGSLVAARGKVVEPPEIDVAA